MNTAFRPSTIAPAPALDIRPRAAFDLAWLNSSGYPEWQTRMLPVTQSVEAAVASMSRGTLIATPSGSVAIEDLEPGMEILNAEGEVAMIRWIGSRTFAEHGGTSERMPLYRVSTGAFGYGAPVDAVVLASAAAVLVRTPGCRKLIGQDQAFAPVAAFEDSYNVTRICPAGDMTVFNMAFDRQETIVANGLPVESFHPGRNTMQFLNDDVLRDMARLFPHIAPADGFGSQRILHLSTTEARSLELF